MRFAALLSLLSALAVVSAQHNRAAAAEVAPEGIAADSLAARGSNTATKKFVRVSKHKSHLKAHNGPPPAKKLVPEVKGAGGKTKRSQHYPADGDIKLIHRSDEEGALLGAEFGKRDDGSGEEDIVDGATQIDEYPEDITATPDEGTGQVETAGEDIDGPAVDEQPLNEAAASEEEAATPAEKARVYTMMEELFHSDSTFSKRDLERIMRGLYPNYGTAKNAKRDGATYAARNSRIMKTIPKRDGPTYAARNSRVMKTIPKRDLDHPFGNFMENALKTYGKRAAIWREVATKLIRSVPNSNLYGSE